LHAAQRRSYGWLGAAGFAVVLVGFVLILAGSVGEFWLFYDQPYGQPNGRDASYTLFLLGHPVLAVGTLLFGIATVRAKVFSRDASMMFASLGTFGALVPVFGTFLSAFPFVWLGYLLWSGKFVGDQQLSYVT
jgi:heme/copper-type cytochrome/quinol oxidase subunit 1